ncbi:YeeE/YedE family protein [Pararhodobacter zhoushanensis]|uniref:YeeE/YedE family protein n=1 Tax=Pararhodobacter zhoushanensis TaxID=2479545 RepID=A0ABT3H2H9_9RHOB|nr:YeeE/YedE family protein [Pararhodobacter zhoushanensis]MCW1934017.1 YeeE/YedE family protein [Pararhodobacter zhoushanensis]
MTLKRIGLVVFALLLVGGAALAAGPRAGLLMAIGIGFGLTLEGLRFGFAGPWRMMVVDRDARGLIAQFLAIALTAAVAFPLLAANPLELSPAHAPIGIGMVLGAFVFGAAMQLVMGCGSGTLVNAGSGNMVGLVALVGFVAGAFLGTLNAGFWASLGQFPLISAQSMAGGIGGLWLTLAGLAVLAVGFGLRAAPGKRRPPARLLLAAALLAALAIANLVVAGQTWGIVYGLGLWGAKIATGLGVDLSTTAFWAAPANAARLDASILTDVTSLTDIGLILGAFLVMRWRKAPGAPAAPLAPRGWVLVLIAGIVLGYSSRMAFGCNVGAFFSGISTGSLHGWAWFVAAFIGSALGLKLRPFVLIPARQAVAA